MHKAPTQSTQPESDDQTDENEGQHDRADGVALQVGDRLQHAKRKDQDVEQKPALLTNAASLQLTEADERHDENRDRDGSVWGVGD